MATTNGGACYSTQVHLPPKSFRLKMRKLWHTAARKLGYQKDSTHSGTLYADNMVHETMKCNNACRHVHSACTSPRHDACKIHAICSGFAKLRSLLGAVHAIRTWCDSRGNDIKMLPSNVNALALLRLAEVFISTRSIHGNLKSVTGEEIVIE